MDLFQALVLGIVQGLTEFLPVSSSAHLALTPWFFGWREMGLSFDVALHLGTLAALLWYFRERWIALTRAAFRLMRDPKSVDAESKLLLLLIVATVPGGLAGKALERYAETSFRSPMLIGTMLTLMGLALWLVDRQAPATRGVESLRWRDALVIGLAQVFALLPGVSRSGSTITAGRALSLDRRAAATFSFLMSMPITLAAVIFKLPDAVRSPGAGLPLIVGVVAAAVSGWVAIAVLLRFVSRHGYGVFAAYRLILAAIVFAVILARR